MKIKYIAISSWFLFCFLQCSTERVTSGNNANKPFFNVLVRVVNEYIDTATLETIKKKNINIVASVNNEPTASELSIQLNNKFPYVSNISNIPEPYFMALTAGAIFIDEDIQGLKNIKVISNVGAVSGTITIPDSIQIIEPSSHDTVAKNENIVVKWSCNADYYLLIVRKVNFDSTATYTYPIDTTITDTSFVISSAFIEDKTRVIEIWLTAYNGSKISYGSYSNMSGDGIGYLYATNAPDFWATGVTVYGPQIVGKKMAVP